MEQLVMEDSRMAAAFSSQLAQRIGSRRFDLWFGSQARLCTAATRLTIRAKNDFARNWLRSHFGDDVRACWQAVAGHSGTIDFDVDDAPAGGSAAEVPILQPGPHAIEIPATSPPEKPLSHGPKKRAEASLASFVVGPSNEYAFQAASLTAHGSQQACPVVFCGATGLGKTHLLRATQREFRRRHPHSIALYLTAEQFTTSFCEACRGSGLPSFRQKCRGAALLLIDDLQFFAGKERTLEELQHTIDTLVAEGRQLVLASDRSPAELRDLSPELASRLVGGLTCEIQTPEFPTRLGILRRLAHEIGFAVDEEILALVATRISAGARELRGALHQLHATRQACDEPITRESAEHALADLARHCTRPVRLADVQKAVCDVFGVEPGELRSGRKVRALSEPRMLAMWLARQYTRAAWSEIGEFFGRRSHSTAISAHRRVERLISSQADIGLCDRRCGVEQAIRKLQSALRTA
jgi:chromosomal replication initiator protein